MQFSPTSCHFIPLWSKYSTQCPVLKHPQSHYISNTVFSWKLRAVFALRGVTTHKTALFAVTVVGTRISLHIQFFSLWLYSPILGPWPPP
jgi:hypothetical protein